MNHESSVANHRFPASVAIAGYKQIVYIALGDQWRVCFRFERGDAFDVEITDYH